MRFRPLLSLFTLSFALIFFGIAGCSEDEDFAPREMVGAVGGTDAFIGLVMGNGHVVVYVCDGTETNATIASWLDGPATESGFDLNSSAVHVKSALATNEMGDLTGTVAFADGIEHPFSASKATSLAGLYRDSSSYEEVVGGWIARSDGQIRGAVRVAVDALQPTPSSLTSSGITATSGNLTLNGVRVVSSSAPKAPATSGTTTSCSAATTCNGHGVCSTSGTCGCNIGFTGASCNACAANFFNYPACTSCSAATTCNGKGTCSAAGACTCNTGFGGTNCNACAADFYGFPACTFCSAAITCNGHGTCASTGGCTCNQGFSGPTCL